MPQQVLELGTFEEIRNGVPLKFRVTTVPEKYIDDAVDLMNKYFIPREPLCCYFKFLNDPKSVKSFDDFWKKLLKEGAGLIAIREGPEDERERIIATNVTFVSHKDKEGDIDIKTGDLFEYVTTLVFDMSEKVNIYEKYNVDKYLSAVGLAVHSDYHGYKVGERLLQCRKPLCQALGVKVTATMFTNPISSHIAQKVGFEHLNQEKYSEYRYKGENVLKDMESGYTYSALEY